MGQHKHSWLLQWVDFTRKSVQTRRHRCWDRERPLRSCAQWYVCAGTTSWAKARLFVYLHCHVYPGLSTRPKGRACHIKTSLQQAGLLVPWSYFVEQKGSTSLLRRKRKGDCRRIMPAWTLPVPWKVHREQSHFSNFLSPSKMRPWKWNVVVLNLNPRYKNSPLLPNLWGPMEVSFAGSRFRLGMVPI